MAGNMRIVFFFVFSSLCDAFLVKEQPLVLNYHNGELLTGDIAINLIWYGRFTPSQRSVIVDFIESLSTTAPSSSEPSVSSWWKTTSKYTYHGSSISSSLKVTHQILHPEYSLGKTLSSKNIIALATKVSPIPTVINVVLTSSDVYVDGFCVNRCGTHGSAYLWVGNAETKCPGYCTWPFHQPLYGPQTGPLLPPNGDVGVDGMIITVASLLANTVTNPFRGGYFQGTLDEGLEATSACTGLFGSGGYPGYTGKLLMDKVSGASFNAYGVRERKYLLPAMWDPETSTCQTSP